MPDDEATHLRVLIANEKRERLELLAQVVTGLGHDVIAREIDVKEVGAVTARSVRMWRLSGWASVRARSTRSRRSSAKPCAR